MNRLEHLLTIAAEECAEVAQRLSKALRFGLLEIQPEQALDNAERVRREFTDLVAMLEMAEDTAGLDRGTLTAIGPEEVARKRRQVERFLAYSETLGTFDATLTEPRP